MLQITIASDTCHIYIHIYCTIYLQLHLQIYIYVVLLHCGQYFGKEREWLLFTLKMVVFVDDDDDDVDVSRECGMANAGMDCDAISPCPLRTSL